MVLLIFKQIGEICYTELPAGKLIKDLYVIKCHIPIKELSRIEAGIRISKETELIHTE